MIKKYNADILRYMALFGQITKITPIDCFLVNNLIVFITDPGKAAKAIGKEGKNIKQVKDTLKRDVKVIEQAQNPQTLVANFLFPLKLKSVDLVEENGNKVINITFKVRSERRTLLDNKQHGLKCLKETVNHFYPDITEIKVL